MAVDTLLLELGAEELPPTALDALDWDLPSCRRRVCAKL